MLCLVLPTHLRHVDVPIGVQGVDVKVHLRMAHFQIVLVSNWARF